MCENGQSRVDTEQDICTLKQLRPAGEAPPAPHEEETMSQAVATGGASRTWNGVQFPSAGTWVLDPMHTTVEFEARHLMVAKVNCLLYTSPSPRD